MLSLTNFAAEMGREKARQRTYDAMLRKAKAGHVASGKVYGYDNVEVVSTAPDMDGNSKRLHVLRRPGAVPCQEGGRSTFVVNRDPRGSIGRCRKTTAG